MTSTFIKTYPDKFQEGQQFKLYPEQENTFVMKGVHLDNEQGLASVIYHPEGDETTTDLWQGRLSEEEALCGSLFVLEDEPDQETQSQKT